MGKYRLSLLIIVAMSYGVHGCSNKASSPSDTLTAMNVTVTDDVSIESTLDDMIFVPNQAAPWLGRLIYKTDDQNQLISMDMEGTRKTPLLIPGSTSWAGLNFKDKPGVFLGIDDGGQLSGFVESDDDGNFKDAIVSGQNPKLKNLCRAAKASLGPIDAITAKGGVTALQISLDDDDLAPDNTVINVKATYDSAPAFDAEMCESIRHTLHINGQDYQLKVSDNTLTLTRTGADQHGYKFILQDGLSIFAPKTIDGVYVTQDNFGSAAFSQGMIAIYDKTTRRLVYISMIYLSEKIKALEVADTSDAGSR